MQRTFCKMDENRKKEINDKMDRVWDSIREAIKANRGTEPRDIFESHWCGFEEDIYELKRALHSSCECSGVATPEECEWYDLCGGCKPDVQRLPEKDGEIDG